MALLWTILYTKINIVLNNSYCMIYKSYTINLLYFFYLFKIILLALIKFNICEHYKIYIDKNNFIKNNLILYIWYFQKFKI